MDQIKDNSTVTPAGSAPATGSETGAKYPATLTVHTPTGPVDACVLHAGKIVNLMRFMGVHCAVGRASPYTECSNCKNQSKFPNSD